jgi:hypothetical protein
VPFSSVFSEKARSVAYQASAPEGVTVCCKAERERERERERAGEGK